MSARCAEALIGAVPRRFFRAFLIAQKGTSSPPAGRNPSLIIEVSSVYFLHLIPRLNQMVQNLLLVVLTEGLQRDL